VGLPTTEVKRRPSKAQTFSKKPIFGMKRTFDVLMGKPILPKKERSQEKSSRYHVAKQI